MIRTRSLVLALACALPSLQGPAPSASGQDGDRGQPIIFGVKTGPHGRKHTPIRFELPEDRLAIGVREALKSGPVPLRIDSATRADLVGPPIPRDLKSIAQAELSEPDKVVVSWVLPDELPAGLKVDYRIVDERPAPPSPWSISGEEEGGLDLKYKSRPVFRYNAAPVSSPNYGPIQVRDAYIHPAYSPSGALITGDFSSSHPHHRGFFLAYERTQSGDLKPDFWNIHLGTGKIHADGWDRPVAGPVTAKFSARHRWEAKDKATGQGTVVLRERWDVEAYAIPNAPYWLFDVTSTQQAVDKPLDLLPYRYGGMAYRGPEPFVKGTLDVLTGEGRHRVDGDQKPTRWVDLTGPVADGSTQYAGAMIVDHPANPNHPTVVRIHPTTLPFFSYVPAHGKKVTIAAGAPTVFRYRVLIHDGHPDPGLDEAIARDFAEPPVVVLE